MEAMAEKKQRCLGFLLFLGGCARFQTFDLPAEAAHTRVNSQEKNGLVVGAELLIDPLSIENHFGPELKDKGYYPVFIYLESRGYDSFEIRRTKFSLVLENGEKLETAPPERVVSEMRRSKLLAVLLSPLIVPPLIISRNREDYNFEMARTLYRKSFPSSLRMERNDPPLCRALFFRDPTGKTHRREEFQSSVLQAVVEIEGSRPQPSEGERVEPPKESQKPVVGKLALFTVSLSAENSR